jgi:hypothetical protein
MNGAGLDCARVGTITRGCSGVNDSGKDSGGAIRLWLDAGRETKNWRTSGHGYDGSCAGNDCCLDLDCTAQIWDRMAVRNVGDDRRSSEWDVDESGVLPNRILT